MFGAKTLNRHAALANTMASRLGVDLTKAMADGRMSAETWRGAVLRCTGCSDPKNCQKFLAETAETGAMAPPDFCRNAGLMESLRPTKD